MLFTQVMVTAGVAYASARTVTADSWKTLRKPLRRPQPTSVATADRSQATAQATETVPLEGEVSHRRNEPAAAQATARYRLAAAGAIILTVGGLAVPGLAVASVPLTIYSSIPIFESAGRALLAQGRIRPATVNSCLIVAALLTNRYMPAALLAWLHHSLWLWTRHFRSVAEQGVSDMLADVQAWLREAAGAPPETAWIVEGEVEVETAFAAVKLGDVLAVGTGEFVPVAGTVVAGAASLYITLSGIVSDPVPVSVGDRLEPGALVVEGKVRISVTRLPAEKPA